MLHINLRPNKFEEVVGNKEVVSSIQSIIQRKEHPRSYLFYGASGCGKTTMARIVAKELGCSETDLNEINSSNNRGIETARDIIRNAQYKPLAGKVKVYILDEVHKTTKDFQDAILKILEDTPSHCYFFLCTTEPEKLLKTIRTRCSSYEFIFPPVNVLSRFLKNIAEKEEKTFSAKIYKSIAENCENSIRQALIVLEQILHCEEEEDAFKVISSIKSQETLTFSLCQALIKNKSWGEVSKIIKGLQEDPEKIRRAVLGYMTAVALNNSKINERSAEIIDNFKDNYYDSGKAGLVHSCILSCL